MTIITDEELEAFRKRTVLTREEITVLCDSLKYSRMENRNVWKENEIYRGERDALERENKRLRAKPPGCL